MARYLRIPEEGMSSIAVVLRSIDSLVLLKVIIEALGPNKATLSSVERDFAAKAKLPLRDAQEIVRQLISLQSLMARLGIGPDEFYDALTESLEVDASDDWKKRNLGLWKEARGTIVSILGPTNPLQLFEKALRLAGEYQNILHFSNIITDLRPIFDEAGSDIVQMQVQHSLGIEYDDGQRRTKVFFALDSADIANLKRVCERAQAKEITLRDKIKTFAGAITIPGETDE